MKRILLFTLVIGLFAVQANAAMWQLDASTARQFTQLSTNSIAYDLQLVIDNPGTAGSTTYVDDGFHGSPAAYGDIMQLAVGFAGTASNQAVSGDDPEMWIGKTFVNEFALGDTLLIPIANDNDDSYWYTAWYSTDSLANIVQGTSLQLGKDTKGSVSVNIPGVVPGGGALTHFGFALELDPSSSFPDNFHTSVVPVPGAVILGILGLGVVGIKLRKYA